MNMQNDIERIVKRCGTNDPFTICDYYHIIVQFQPLGSICGIHQYACHQDIIHINEALDDVWKRFTCAHELGHAFLHERTNTSWLARYTGFSVDRVEHQADEFAVRLLTYGMKPIEGMTIRQAAAIYGVLPDRAEMLRAVV